MLSIEFSVCWGSNRVTKRISNDQGVSLMLTKKNLARCHLLKKSVRKLSLQKRSMSKNSIVETHMSKWMSRHTLKDIIQNENIRKRIDISQNERK